MFDTPATPSGRRDPSRHARLLRLATRASLGVAVTLVVAKAVAWWVSGSVSLLAGLTDSLLDSAASLLNLLAVRYALKPADDDHRYGHGKAEALAGVGQALFIGGSAVLIAIQAVEHLNHPPVLGEPLLGIAVMLFSILLTVALLVLQRHVIRATGSTAVHADSLHYRSDLLLNGAILLALLLTAWGWTRLDGVFGLAIAAYILFSAVQIAHGALHILMDREVDLEVSERMLRLVLAVPGVLGAHDLRTRISGGDWFVQVHLELPANQPLREAHAVCEAAEAAIRRAYPQAEVLVHADPVEP